MITQVMTQRIKLTKFQKSIILLNLFLRSNEGKGSAIKKGIEMVTGDIVIFQDADLEYNPEDYKN